MVLTGDAKIEHFPGREEEGVVEGDESCPTRLVNRGNDAGPSGASEALY